ncbi:MAG: hypothetical protein ACK5TH_02890 [Prosthecobacter sp.]|jgi:hypothetical protein
MNRIAFIALALLPALLLCSCGSAKDKKKKKDLMDQTLGQRLNKPDMNRTSPFQKYMDDPSQERSIGSKWQTQEHHVSNFSGANQAKGLNYFKTSDAKGLTMSRDGQATFSGAGKTSQFGSQTFDASMSRDATKMSRDGSTFFRDGGKTFGTDSALPSSQQIGKAPKVIENRPFDDLSKTYSEDEIKRLLGRP